MTRLGSLVSDILHQSTLGWQEAKAINRYLANTFPSQSSLDALQHLLQAISDQKITLNLKHQPEDLTASIRLWQLYLINHSKSGCAPSLTGAAATCLLPYRAVKPFSGILAPALADGLKVKVNILRSK